ncbi:MAG: TolC family protein [Nitrospirae bacterium]|nr:TolC family protein [Nitrospirota bacterium]
MKTYLILAALVLVLVPAAYAEDIIRKGELLTLERAVEIGLKMHPSVRAGKGSVDVNRARRGQAESAYYPQVDANAGYTRFQPSTVSTGTTTVGIRRLQESNSFEQYNTSVTARQTLFDFGKTRTNVNIQKLNIEASQADLANTEEQVILNVKQAYYNLLRAKRNRVVAEETIKQFEQHLGQAKAFYEVGTKPKFDVTKAEVDLSTARLSQISAENAVRIAYVSLNNAMGAPDAPEYVIEDKLSFEKYQMTVDEAMEKAYANRPELKSILAKKKASEEAIALARKGYYPVLTGNADWTWAGERFANGDGWSAGVGLSIPIFSGFLTRNQVSEAKANLVVLTANEESLRQTVLLEVQQSLLNLREAEERISTAELTVRQAQENYEIANGRYAAGVGNPIEVTDAEVALANAKTSYIQALYDFRVARASLEKAMGSR